MSGRADYERMSKDELLAELDTELTGRMALTEVTRLKKVAAELSTALAAEHRLRRRLDAIGHALVMVSEAALEARAPGVAHVLQTVVNQARELVGAEFAALGIDGEEDRSFNPWVYSGITEEQATALGSPPRRIGVLQVASSAATAIRLRDLREHPAFRGFPADHPPMMSFLGVPIRRGRHAIGTLYLANKIGADEFTEDDERAVELLAGRVAITMELARLRDIEARGFRWLREVVAQMPDAVLLVDGDHGVSLNQAAVALFGDAAGPDGHIVIEAFTPGGAPVPADELPHMRASRGEQIAGLELSIRRRDGTLVPVVVNAVPVRDGLQETAVAVYRDMTVVKQLELEREEWMSVVAHDLRQPASVISFSAQLLARFGEGLGPREAKSVERIGSSSGILNRMIDDLLDATLIETRRLSIKPQPIDIVALVRDVIDRSTPILAGRSIRVWAPEEAAVAPADPDRLGQVLMNLLSNAAKYSEPSSEIVVHVERADGEIEVAVTNRGKGLTAAEVARLFRRFYRTRTAEAGTSAGLGLGLYIVKGLVEAHGGRIWVESEPDKTTTFRLRLPEGTGS